MVLEGAGFCVSQDESKSEIHFKDGSLICKMRLSFSRRREGLMVDRRKLYQSCNRLRRLKRVRIWDQC